jgi:SNF2 family DNA or RNA helicase
MKYDGVYALFYDVGTGKTRCVIDYLGILASHFDTEIRVLVCAPRSVVDTWELQAAQWASPSVPFTVEVLTGSIAQKQLSLSIPTWGQASAKAAARVSLKVVNYEALSSRRARGSKLDSDLWLDAVKKYQPHVLICDESQRAKSHTSNVARLLHRIAPLVKRRILLTGTPMPHSPLDAYSQFKILDPEVFWAGHKPMSFAQFEAKVAKLGGYLGKQVMGWQNLDWLENKMATRSHALTKADCLDLPPVTHVDVPVRLSDREQKAYDKVKKDMVLALEAGATMSTPSMLINRLRLRQLTCGFAKEDGSDDIHWLGHSRLDTAADLVGSLLESTSRVVVFGWALAEIEELAARLGPAASLITGKTPDAERIKLRKQFGDVENHSEPMVLIAQWRTISLGINELVTANHAVMLSLTEQREDVIQAIGRLDRPGQTRPVTVHWLLVRGTVDEVVRKSHMDRTDLEQGLLDYLKGSK